MPFVNVKALEGFLSLQEKQRLIKEITDVVVAIKGEDVRNGVWVAVEDVSSGAWGIGGEILVKKPSD